VGPIRVRGTLTSIRPATEEDADLLVAWHADPEVSRYWDGKTFARDAMLERLRRPDVEPFVIEDAGRPVGYLQACARATTAGSTCSLSPMHAGEVLGRTQPGPSLDICLKSATGAVSQSIPISGTTPQGARGAERASARSKNASRIPSTRRVGC